MPAGQYDPDISERTRQHAREAIQRARQAAEDAEFEYWVRVSVAVHRGVLSLDEVCEALGISKATYYRKQIKQDRFPGLIPRAKQQ